MKRWNEKPKNTPIKPYKEHRHSLVRSEMNGNKQVFSISCDNVTIAVFGDGHAF